MGYPIITQKISLFWQYARKWLYQKVKPIRQASFARCMKYDTYVVTPENMKFIPLSKAKIWLPEVVHDILPQ